MTQKQFLLPRKRTERDKMGVIIQRFNSTSQAQKSKDLVDYTHPLL